MKTRAAQIGILLTVLVLLVGAALPLSATTENMTYSIESSMEWSNAEGIYANGGSAAIFTSDFSDLGMIFCEVTSSLPDGAVITEVKLTADVWGVDPFDTAWLHVFFWSSNTSLGRNIYFHLFPTVTDAETRYSATASEDFVYWLNHPDTRIPWEISIYGEDMMSDETIIFVDYVALTLTYTTPEEGSDQTVVVVPLGANEDTFLDQVLPLAEGVEPPMIGPYPLSASYEAGDLVTGSCLLCDCDGRVMVDGWVIVETYRLTLDGRKYNLEQLSHEVFTYDWGTRCHSFICDTSDLDPGYYVVYLVFPDGSNQELCIEVVAPVE